MTDEQLEKAIMCWTGTTVSEKECMACPYNDKCTLEEIANEIIHRWRECKTENATLRERLEKSVELPFKLGNRVWFFHYDEETELPDEVVSSIFIGGNKKYAFLSPRVYAGKLITKPNALCQYFFGEYKKFEDECDCDVIPYSECFKTREEAEARLAELKGEER